MKRLNITFFLTLLMSMISIKSNAYDFEVNGIYYNVVSIEDLTCEIAPQSSNHSYYSGYFVIPSNVQYNGKTLKVIRIGDSAFSISSITSVTIPNSVTSIGKYAFSDCTGMTSINIPNSVTSIGEAAFINCSSLTSVNIPNSVTSIGGFAFEDCTGLTSITIPGSVTSINNNAFRNCISLTSVTIPSSDVSSIIGAEAFRNCTSLTSINIPNVTLIGASAFYGCTALTTLNMSNVEDIGEDAFRGCTSIHTLTIPSSCKKIKHRAFNGCIIRKLVLEDSSNTLKLGLSGWRQENYADEIYYKDLFSHSQVDTLYWGRSIDINFSYANPLYRDYNVPGIFGNQIKKIVVGNQITDNDIYKGYSSSLFNFNGNSERPLYYNITFGKGISTVPNMSYDDNLDSLFLLNETPPNAKGFSNKQYLHCNLFVPKGSKTAYQSADVWKNFWNILEFDPYAISFADAKVKAICVAQWDTDGDGELNESEAAAVTDLGTAFKSKTSITSFNELKYFTGLTVLGNDAFSGCISLTSIAIPPSLTRVKTGAFKNCSSLAKIIVTDIAAWCGIIYEGNSYSNGDFPLNKAQHLYSDENIEITNVVIPESVTRIEPLAFRDAKYITSVTIPNSVTYIGREAFRGMHRLTSINIPLGITSVEPYVLQDCETLASVSIPESVTSIGDNAFAKCYGLKNVYCYSEGVPSTGSNVFSNTNVGAATLHVPAGSVSQYRTTSPWSGFGTIEALEGVLATGISLNQTTLSFNAPNQTATLAATITPSNATNKNITWTSSNTAVATVSNAGVITAIANGMATITAKTTDGTNLTATCEVTVSIPVLATGISLNQTTLSFNAPNQTATLTATITPSNATNKTVSWTSSNTAVATVSNAGVVTAIANGTATITAKTTDGTNLIATCTVIVSEVIRINIVTSNAGYSTFYDSHYDYVLPNGLTAQVVTNVSNNKLVYKTIANGNTSGIVPRGTAVMLVSDNKRYGTFALTSTASSAPYSGANLLHGSDVATRTTGNGYHYKLSYGKTGTSWNDVFGWYWGAQDGAPFQIESNKAWLVVPQSAITRASAGYTIDGDATDITDIELDDEKCDIYYDMQGRRISTPSNRGIYIKNGKKVVIK